MNAIEWRQGAKWAIFRSPGALPIAIARASGATLPLSSQQVPSREVKIGQRCRYEQPMRILGQAAVAHFDKAEDALDDADGVLDLGPDLRLGAILGPLFWRQIAIATTALLGEVLGPRRVLPKQFPLASVSGVAVDPPLAAVQKVRQSVLVMNIGRTRRHRMNQLGLAVYTDVGLHPEVPLVTLLRLLHLGVPLAVLILGRTGRVDDGGIDDGTGGNLQALRLQMSVDRGKQLPAQIMALEQMTKAQDRGLVGRRLAPQINAHKLPHRQRVVQRFLRRRIRKVEPLLQEIDPQHPFQPNWRPSARAFAVYRLNQRAQLLPWHYPIHLREKPRPARRLGVLLESGVAQRHLSHPSRPVQLDA